MAKTILISYYLSADRVNLELNGAKLRAVWDVSRPLRQVRRLGKPGRLTYIVSKASRLTFPGFKPWPEFSSPLGFGATNRPKIP